MATECSPGRKPGVSAFLKQVSPRSGRQTMTRSVARFAGSGIYLDLIPGLHSLRSLTRGYSLPPSSMAGCGPLSTSSLNDPKQCLPMNRDCHHTPNQSSFAVSKNFGTRRAFVACSYA
jgi:hypothetical protein